MEYGERLSAALKHAKKSRRDLAEALHITQQAVGQVIRGASGAFNATNNSRAAAFLGVSALWLATETGTIDDLTHPASKPFAANESVPLWIDEMTDAEKTMLADIRILADEDREDFAREIAKRAAIQRKHSEKLQKIWGVKNINAGEAATAAMKITDKLKQKSLLDDQ